VLLVAEYMEWLPLNTLKLLRIVKVGFTETMHASPHVTDASDHELERITASD
jgi:hypothetical protein